MLTKTLLGFAALAVGLGAGCAVEAVDPIVLSGRVDCVSAALVLGVDLGNREVTITPGADGSYRFEEQSPGSFTLKPIPVGVHLHWAADLGVYAVLTEQGPDTVVRLRDPGLTGGLDLLEEMGPGAGKTRATFRVCWILR